MSLVKSYHATYKEALSHTVLVTALFNSGAKFRTRCARFLEKTLFLVVFFGLLFFAILVVFARSGIDTWIKFSLYIVPLFSMICGHLIFKSNSFKEILKRRVVQNGTTANETDFETFERDRQFDNLFSFLGRRSLRTFSYPLSLVLYQWIIYMIFFYDNDEDKGVIGFTGSLNMTKDSSHLTRGLHFIIEQKLWWPLYSIFWSVAMYITGFVAFCFILVADIHKFDIKTFLCKIGDGPMIQTSINSHTNVYRKSRSTVGFCFRMLSLFTGCLTLGLLEPASRPRGKAQQMLDISGYEDTQDFAGEVSDSGNRWSSSAVDIENENGASSSGERGGPPITPREASKLLIELMSNLETNSALFKPFLVLLTFFSATNLVTLFVAMAILKIDNFTDLHWWTLVRTLILFLLAIRLLWTVATITNTLSRIIPHIYYLRSVGELAGAKQEWDDFFQLAETFRFGSRTYGFPLTLHQVGRFVAILNFSFLIILSLISKTEK